MSEAPRLVRAHAHDLKTDPAAFEAVLQSRKTHEIRLDDRAYAVGDVLRLHETTHTGEQMRNGAPLEFSGRQVRRVVSHIERGYGLAPGWCILSFEHKADSARGTKRPPR